MPLWGNKVQLHIAIFTFIIFLLIPHVSPHCMNRLPWSQSPRMILCIAMSPIRAYWYSAWIPIQLGYNQSSPSAADNLLIYNIPPLQHTRAQRRWNKHMCQLKERHINNVHILTHTRTQTFTHTHTQSPCTHRHTHKHTQTHTDTHTHTRTHTHTYPHTHTQVVPSINYKSNMV